MQGGSTMGYNIIDILNKAINITRRKREMYEEIGLKKCDIPKIQVMSKVLGKEANSNIQRYEKLKSEVSGSEVDEIDFGVYDKISFLINEFSRKVYVPEISNVREFLEFSLNLEEDTHSLLIDIQGRFVKKASDIHTKTYKILSDIINSKAEHISTLKKMLKK